MKIDVELDENESALFLMMLGAGSYSINMMVQIDEILALVNKLMKDNPDFIPYAVTTRRKGA